MLQGRNKKYVAIRVDQLTSVCGLHHYWIWQEEIEKSSQYQFSLPTEGRYEVSHHCELLNESAN